jgi:hypothetical protein
MLGEQEEENTIIEYIITMKNGEEEIFNEIEKADDKFEEIKNDEQWSQFFKKEWLKTDDEENYEEGDVELYASIETFEREDSQEIETKLSDTKIDESQESENLNRQ